MSVNVSAFSYSYLDQRIRIRAILETQPSDVLYPFFTACWLIPKSRVGEYLNGNFKDGVFYKVKEYEYATKCLGEFLDGITRFYSQPHTNAEAGFLIFEDKYALDPADPNVLTDYVDAPQAQRLATMNDCLGAIGRNAIYVGVAETEAKKYNMIMDDFRQVDSLMSYLKCKVTNTLVSTEEELQDALNDFEAFGATLECMQEVKQAEDTDVLNFKNRADFVIGGVLLNPYQPAGSSSIYKVGVGLDATIVNLTSADVVLNKDKTMLDEITKKGLTYFQVRADDPTEILVAGGGVYFQGQVIPVNMFLLAKYVEYLLKTNIFRFQEQNKSGVANVAIYRSALSATSVEIDPYINFLLSSYTIQNYTQAGINENIVDKTLKLDKCITMVTLPTFLFTEATITLIVS